MALKYSSCFLGAFSPNPKYLHSNNQWLLYLFFFRLPQQNEKPYSSGHHHNPAFNRCNCLTHFLFASQKQRYVGSKRWELPENISFSNCPVSGKIFNQRKVVFIWIMGRKKQTLGPHVTGFGCQPSEFHGLNDTNCWRFCPLGKKCFLQFY